MDILVVEDNRELSVLLCDFLRAEGYTVSSADTGEKALAYFDKYGARLVILDVNLPGMDGFAVCSEIRKNSNTPIIIVSARVDKDDKLNGLITGADDYIEKPYDIDILLAKIKGIFMRRYSLNKLTDGGVALDISTNTVTKNGKAVDVTLKEFELLKLLMENKGRTLDKNYIFNRVWGADSFSEPQTLTVHIKWLRQKIEDDPRQPTRILTVWGKGYRYGDGQ